jgi:excisionase family DNA binding protein
VPGTCPARLLTIDAAASYLSVSPWTVRDLLHAGTLQKVSVPVGDRELRRVLLDRVDLDRLIEAWKS